MNKDEILAFLDENPDYVLQNCRGIGDHHWWWLLSTAGASKTINVDGRSARAAAKCLKVAKSGWRACSYARSPSGGRPTP